MNTIYYEPTSDPRILVDVKLSKNIQRLKELRFNYPTRAQTLVALTCGTQKMLKPYYRLAHRNSESTLFYTYTDTGTYTHTQIHTHRHTYLYPLHTLNRCVVRRVKAAKRGVI